MDIRLYRVIYDVIDDVKAAMAGLLAPKIKEVLLGHAEVRQVIRTLEQRNEVYFPLEFRFVKADDAWLSPFYQRETCSIAVHASADEAYQYLLTDINPLFRAHQGRPHWGKLHWMGAAELSTMYPRWQDFQRVRQQFDPQGQMLNAHLRKLFLKA